MATLGYWGFRGIAQPIRFLLAYLGVEYTEKQYSYETPEEWFGKDKQGLGLDFPNIPYYIDKDIKITESSAIPFYLIKKYNKPELLGQNPDGSFNESESRVQQVIGVLRDGFTGFVGTLFNPSFESSKETVFAEKLSPSLVKLTDYLADKEFLVGSLSYADFLFYELLSYARAIFPNSITEKLAAYIKRFENLPGIKEYIAKPTVNLDHFLNPKYAVWSGIKGK